jgi:hypothetical protein
MLTVLFIGYHVYKFVADKDGKPGHHNLRWTYDTSKK